MFGLRDFPVELAGLRCVFVARLRRGNFFIFAFYITLGRRLRVSAGKCIDPYNFFTPERAQFLLRCTSEFEITSSRLALGVCPFFVTGALILVNTRVHTCRCVYGLGAHEHLHVRARALAKIRAYTCRWSFLTHFPGFATTLRLRMEP